MSSYDEEMDDEEIGQVRLVAAVAAALVLTCSFFYRDRLSVFIFSAF